MTHHLSTLSFLRTARSPFPPRRRPAVPAAIPQSSASTALALSMMMALRYLEAQDNRHRPSAVDGVASPVLS